MPVQAGLNLDTWPLPTNDCKLNTGCAHRRRLWRWVTMAVGWRNRHGNDDFGKVMLAGTGVTLPLVLSQQGVSLMMRKITTVSMAAKLQNVCVHTHVYVCV